MTATAALRVRRYRLRCRQRRIVTVVAALAALAACLTIATGAAAQAVTPASGRSEPPRWTLGSPAALVVNAQGQPQLVERLASLGYEVWRYGDNWVRLSDTDHHVAGWWNADGALLVELLAGADTTQERTFTTGSSRDDVVRLQGTPTGLEARPEFGVVLLRYATAVVSISSRDRRVVSWRDARGSLRTRPGEPLARATTDAAARGGPRHTARTAPPSLTARAALAGLRTNSADVLDAESHDTLAVTVWNDGPGTAYGVTVSAALEQPTPELDIGRGTRADSVPARTGITLGIPLATSDALRDGSIVMRVRATASNGRVAAFVPSLVLRTRALHPPVLALEGIGVRDQSGNGRIEPREIVDLVARVTNHGTGPARAVRYVLVVGRDVHLTPESPRAGMLGDVPAGASRDVQFSAFASAGAARFPVTLEVHEARARFDTSFVLPLALDQPIAALPTLTVRGRDLAAVGAPPPLVVDVDSGIARAPARPAAVAVVLGVERYERAPGAVFARHDAAVFREYARNVFGIGDDASRLLFRTDDEVTAGELHRIFDTGGWLSRRVTPETDVIVYWAGHGQTDVRTKQTYLLPNDADPNYPAQTGLALAELYDRLTALKARSVVVFIDACFSGMTREAGALLADARGAVVSLENPVLHSATMAVFSAATGEQVASAWPERQHGIFTYWLLKGLRGGADADGDGRLNVGELERFVHAGVARTAASRDREQTSQVIARDKSLTLVRLR
ncbi:MAG: caspase family protein [Gemmatimonadaceae bacterium]